MILNGKSTKWTAFGLAVVASIGGIYWLKSRVEKAPKPSPKCLRKRRTDKILKKKNVSKLVLTEESEKKEPIVTKTEEQVNESVKCPETDVNKPQFPDNEKVSPQTAIGPVVIPPCTAPAADEHQPQSPLNVSAPVFVPASPPVSETVDQSTNALPAANEQVTEILPSTVKISSGTEPTAPESVPVVSPSAVPEIAGEECTTEEPLVDETVKTVADEPKLDESLVDEMVKTAATPKELDSIDLPVVGESQPTDGEKTTGEVAQQGENGASSSEPMAKETAVEPAETKSERSSGWNLEAKEFVPSWAPVAVGIDTLEYTDPNYYTVYDGYDTPLPSYAGGDIPLDPGYQHHLENPTNRHASGYQKSGSGSRGRSTRGRRGRGAGRAHGPAHGTATLAEFVDSAAKGEKTVSKRSSRNFKQAPTVAKTCIFGKGCANKENCGYAHAADV
ncbi:hypothetical protein DFS34DRAFT_617921 [Phlyctochytrium arcticum]|nr:hypothetical protein DFS34DRAFT_617921 [Phlyctochytrium arcticum]